MRTWNCAIMWLPDPVDFVSVNYSELSTYADIFCKTEWDKREFCSYVMYYFLTHKTGYKQGYKNEFGIEAKISTWLYSTVKFIKLKYYYDVIKDCVEGRMSECKRGLIPESECKRGLIPEGYISERIEALKFEDASDSAFNIHLYKKYLIRKYQNKCSWIVNALKVMSLSIKGYGNSEIAPLLKLTTVRVSQLRRKLKVNYDEFKLEKLATA